MTPSVKELLQAYGIRQCDMVHRLGYSRQQAYQVWHGHTNCGKRTILRLHRAFGIPVDELIHARPAVKPSPDDEAWC